MRTKIFHVFPIWSGVPMTVLARDQLRATEMFGNWCRLYAPSLSADPCLVREADWFFADDHPSLKQAAKDGEAGVAYWQNFETGWTVAAPACRAGLLAPPEPAVKQYRIYVDDGEDALVFATSGADAILMFLDYHERAYGHQPSQLDCVEHPIWSLGEGHAPLRFDMLAGLSGIGGQDDEGSYHIYPADHPRAGNFAL